MLSSTGDTSSSRLYWPFSTGTGFLHHKTLRIYHPALRIHRTLWEVREGTLTRLELHKLAWIAGVAGWETLSLAATATSVCKHEWLCLLRARWLQRNGQVWHGKKKKLWSWTSSSFWNRAQANAVQLSNSTSSHLVVLHNTVDSLEDELGPRRFYQPLISATLVDDTTEFYCI